MIGRLAADGSGYISAYIWYDGAGGSQAIWYDGNGGQPRTGVFGSEDIGDILEE